MDITAHMIIKNEEQWVWYAIQSVITYVKKIYIYDTGSIDATVKIITSIVSDKISFAEKGPVNAKQLISLRNDQIKLTATPWFLLLDGDEVWPEKAIKKLTESLNNIPTDVTAIGLKTRMPVGDLYHYIPENAGKYKLKDKKGNFNVRAYKIKPGYRWKGTYPLEAYADQKGMPVQNKEKELLMLDEEYWHLTHLKRSSVDDHGKRKFEIGRPEPEVLLPEVFNINHPQFIPSPWVKFNTQDRIKASVLTPILKVKRMLYQ